MYWIKVFTSFSDLYCFCAKLVVWWCLLDFAIQLGITTLEPTPLSKSSARRVSCMFYVGTHIRIHQNSNFCMNEFLSIFCENKFFSFLGLSAFVCISPVVVRIVSFLYVTCFKLYVIWHFHRVLTILLISLYFFIGFCTTCVYMCMFALNISFFLFF